MQQNTTQARRPQLSRADVINAIERQAGIPRGGDVLYFVGGPDGPFHAKVSHAAAEGDGGALAAYCAEAVSTHLMAAGLEVPIDASVLRAIAGAEDGWEMVRDVAEKRENAAHALTHRIERFRRSRGMGGGAQPRQSGGQDPGRQQDRREQPGRADERFQQQAYQQRGDRDPGQAPATTREPAPPPRRTDGATVRQIGEARRARELESEQRAEQRTEATWESVKVHGGKSALTLEATTTRRHNEPTINIEAAKLKDAASRTYDWQNKIIVQLTTTELQQVTCLLYGMIDRVKFQNHGPQNDKWFEIERQTGQYAGTTKFAVGQGKEMCLVQLTPADLGDVLALFIRQCARQMKLDQAALYGALRPVAMALNDQANRGASRSRTG